MHKHNKAEKKCLLKIDEHRQYRYGKKCSDPYSEAQFKKSIIMSLIIHRKAYTPYKEKNKKYIRRNLEKRNVCKKQIYNVNPSKKR